MRGSNTGRPGLAGGWLLIAGAVAAVLIPVLTVPLVRAAHRLSRTVITELDVAQAQVGVRQVLTDPINGYGQQNVGAVTCNQGRNPTVRRGESFTCQVSVDGVSRQVTAVFADDSGTYSVDRPR